MSRLRRGCEGVAKGCAKGFAKALTCKSKGSKGFSYAYAHKKQENQHAPYTSAAPGNPFDPFEPQVNPFANPFAHPFATPSQSGGGA
jgi:hypothetical protein